MNINIAIWNLEGGGVEKLLCDNLLFVIYSKVKL